MVPEGAFVLPRVLAAGPSRGTNWYSPIPANKQGLAIEELIQRFVQECIAHNVEHPTREQDYLYIFASACGRNSAYYNCLTRDRSTDPEYQGMTLLEMGCHIANLQSQVHDAKMAQAEQPEGLQKLTALLAGVYPQFVPTTAQSLALANAQLTLRSLGEPDQAPSGQLRVATDLLLEAQMSIDRDRAAHEGLFPEEQLGWLLSHPDAGLQRAGRQVRETLDMHLRLRPPPPPDRHEERTRRLPRLTAHEHFVGLLFIARVLSAEIGAITVADQEVFMKSVMMDGEYPSTSWLASLGWQRHSNGLRSLASTRMLLCTTSSPRATPTPS